MDLVEHPCQLTHVKPMYGLTITFNHVVFS